MHERDLYAYILGISKAKQCFLHRINSMPDHVHMCVNVHPSVSLSDFVKTIKQQTSKWLKEHHKEFPGFDGWGNGYAAFTYSEKERPVVIEYIKRQKEHHKVKSFREEFEEWLCEMGLDTDSNLFFKD